MTSTLTPVPDRVRWTRESGPVVRRAKRRRRLLQLLLAGLLGIALGAAIWLVWFSSVLIVRSVQVVGVTGPAPDAVLSAADVPVGVPIIRVDTSAVTRRVAQLPWIAAVRVDRRLPDAIVITAVPRVPVAIQAQTGFGIDRDGRAFAPVQELPASLMRIDASGAALDAATATWLGLPDSLRTLVASVSATSPDDIVLHLKAGPIIRWGGTGRVELKVRVLSWLMRQPAAVYNVSAPELPVTVGG